MRLLNRQRADGVVGDPIVFAHASHLFASEQTFYDGYRFRQSLDPDGSPVKIQASLFIFRPTSVRLKREQIQLIALDAVVRFVFDSGNRLTEQHFFEERHGQDL
jgi:hypothetical protein